MSSCRLAISFLAWLSATGGVVAIALSQGDDGVKVLSGDSSVDDRESEEIGRFLLTALWPERERIFSGRCRVKEQMYKGRNEAASEVTGTWEIVFDASQDAIRVEYISAREPYRSFIYSEYGEATAIYTHEQNNMQVSAPGEATRKTRPKRFLDPRNLGFLTSPDINRTRYEEIRQLFGTTDDLEGVLESEESPFCRLTIKHRNTNTIREILLDPAKNYATVHVEVRWPDKVNGGWTEPMDIVDTEWKEYSDIWVPVRSVFKERWNDDSVRILEIEWLEVNSSIPPEEFAWDSLPLPVDATISDGRLDPSRPIMVK